MSYSGQHPLLQRAPQQSPGEHHDEHGDDVNDDDDVGDILLPWYQFEEIFWEGKTWGCILLLERERGLRTKKFWV